MLVVQVSLTLCDCMDCSLLGSPVHGILQARILEWVFIPFSRGSSWPRDRTQVSCIAGIFFTTWATREALMTWERGLSQDSPSWEVSAPARRNGHAHSLLISMWSAMLSTTWENCSHTRRPEPGSWIYHLLMQDPGQRLLGSLDRSVGRAHWLWFSR